MSRFQIRRELDRQLGTGNVPDYAGIGAAAGTGVTAGETIGTVQKTVLTLDGTTSVTMADEAGVVAHGGLKVYDFPLGLILILGAVVDLTVTKSGSGINADFDGDFALGTVTASNNNTLTSTEANIVASTAMPQASAGITLADGNNTGVVVINGMSTAADVYANFLIDDSDQDGGGSLLLDGTITLYWMNFGSNAA